MRLAYLFAAGALCAAAQTLAVTPPDLPGLELLGPGSVGYEAGLAAILGSPLPPQLAAYLPYAVVLKNGSNQALVAYHIRWAIDPRPNQPRTGGAETGVLATTGTSLYLQPGQLVVAIPMRILNQAPSAALLADLEQHPGSLARWSKAKNIVVSLDSVILQSGQFIGPDVGGNFNQDAASFSSWRTVYNMVEDQLTNGVPFADIVPALEQIASQQPPPAPRESRNWDLIERAATARHLVNVYQRRSAQAATEMVSQQLQSPVVLVHK